MAAQRASAANTMSHERARATPQGWLGGRRKSAHEFRPIESMVASHWLNSWSHAERVHSVLWLLLAWSSLRAPDSWAPPSSPYKHCSTSVLLSRYCLVCSSNVCGLGGAAYRCSPPISASSRTIFTNSKRRRTLNLQPFGQGRKPFLPQRKMEIYWPPSARALQTLCRTNVRALRRKGGWVGGENQLTNSDQ